MQLEVLTTADPTAWAQALAQAGRHDFYHEAWYHALAEARGEGRAELLVASHRGATVAVPLLFRPIGTQLGRGFEGLEDATSVYGYPGPVGPHDQSDAREIRETRVTRDLGAAMTAYLRERGVVSVFSRLHPLLDHASLDGEVSGVVEAGKTASIDLSRTAEQQCSDMRSGHRNGLSRLRRAGFTCERRGAAGLEVFIGIYEATMRRLDAKPGYLFSQAHYDALVDHDRGAMELFVVVDAEQLPAAAGLFSLRCGIAQYHLSGATLEHRKHAPTTLMIDDARRWALERGATHLHLGGGLGGAGDSLFDFKAGFGTGRHTFRVWREVLRPEVYRELAALRLRTAAATATTFFPIYRAP